MQERHIAPGADADVDAGNDAGVDAGRGVPYCYMERAPRLERPAEKQANMNENGIEFEEILIDTRGPAPIRADLRSCRPEAVLPLIIICHGFLGHRRWGFFSHSRGASIAMLVAPGFTQVRSLVIWATPSRLDRYTDRRKKQWKREGALVFKDPQSPVPLRLDYSYYEDIERNRERFDLPALAASLEVPHLMIHGERDAAVTLKETKRLLAAHRNGTVKLEVLKACGHTFGVRDPMHGTTRHLERAVELTERWLLDTLKMDEKEDTRCAKDG